MSQPPGRVMQLHNPQLCGRRNLQVSSETRTKETPLTPRARSPPLPCLSLPGAELRNLVSSVSSEVRYPDASASRICKALQCEAPQIPPSASRAEVRGRPQMTSLEGIRASLFTIASNSLTPQMQISRNQGCLHTPKTLCTPPDLCLRGQADSKDKDPDLPA